MKLLIFSCLAVVLLFIVLVAGSNWVLTKNYRVDAQILIIEGWLPASNLEMISTQINFDKYEKVFVTGIAHNHPEHLKNKRSLSRMPAKLFSNGCLGIGKKVLKHTKLTDTVSEIKVFAYGSEALGRFPNFFVAVDDSVIGNAFVTKAPSNYVFRYNCVHDFHDIYVYFNNDVDQRDADRNLIVDSISINGLVLNKPDDFYIINDHDLNNNLVTNYPFRSNAVLTTNYLKTLGVKKDIITLDTFFNKRNKTKAAAERLRSFMGANVKSAKSISIISVNGHSRRSYLAYKSVFYDKIQIGVISLKDIEADTMQRKKWLKRIIGEYGKLFVTTILYLFS